MSFSAEMKDFLNAYQTGTKINASRTDQEYKEALTDAQKKKTERENDPEQLALQDQQARATLAATNARTGLTVEQTKNAPVSRGYTAALTDRIRKADAAGAEPPVGSGILPPTMAPGAAVGGGTGVPAAPVITNTMVPATENYAEGGAIPDDDTRERGYNQLRSEMTADRKTRGLGWRGNRTELGMSRAATTEDDLEADRKGKDRFLNSRILYAGGGAIPDTDGPDSEPDNDPDDGLPTDFSSRGRGGPNTGLPAGGFAGVVSPKLIDDAVRGGYNYGVRAYGLNGGIRSPRQQAAAKALAQGQGGLTPQEMDAARKAVDPEGKLTDSQRNMSALGAVYQYWANQGEPEKAQKVAFQMLQHFRLASQRYAAIAAHAAEQGNMDLATRAAVKAYANVPDGRDMTMTVGQDGRILYHYVDENGKTITKGLATPQELASSAMGLAKGGFDQAILSAAGVREEQAKATSGGNKGGKGNPLADLKNTGELLDDPISKATEAWKKKTGTDLNEDTVTGLRNTATHIMQQNPKATPQEAVEAAANLLMQDKGGPSPSFNTTSQDGTNNIRFKSGQSVSLDDPSFDAIMTQRAARIKATQDKEAADAAEAAKPSRLGQAVEGAKRVGGAIAGLADDISPARAAASAAGALAPEELKIRGKAALDTARDAASDFGRRVMDPNNIPAVAAYKGLRDTDYGALTGAIQTGVQSALEHLRGTGAIPDQQEATPPELIGP